VTYPSFRFGPSRFLHSFQVPCHHSLYLHVCAAITAREALIQECVPISMSTKRHNLAATISSSKQAFSHRSLLLADPRLFRRTYGTQWWATEWNSPETEHLNILILINLAFTEGHLDWLPFCWRRHRRVCLPPFLRRGHNHMSL